MDSPALDFGALFAWCDLHVSRWHRRTQAMMNRLNDRWEFTFPMYYDRAGFPIPGDEAAGIPPVIAWARYREGVGLDQVRVAYDELPDGSFLSTVWIGLDQQHGFGKPQIFETMRFGRETHTVLLPSGGEMTARENAGFPDIFGEDGETADQYRYSTEEEALAAHHEIVRRLRITEGH